MNASTLKDLKKRLFREKERACLLFDSRQFWNGGQTKLAQPGVQEATSALGPSTTHRLEQDIQNPFVLVFQRLSFPQSERPHDCFISTEAIHVWAGVPHSPQNYPATYTQSKTSRAQNALYGQLFLDPAGESLSAFSSSTRLPTQLGRAESLSSLPIISLRVLKTVRDSTGEPSTRSHGPHYCDLDGDNDEAGGSQPRPQQARFMGFVVPSAEDQNHEQCSGFTYGMC